MAIWQENTIGDDREWTETDDPRMVAVIERQTDPAMLPDGDAFAPAYWLDYIGGAYVVRRAGSTFDDEQTADAYVAARTQLGEVNAERYMRAFHGTGVLVLDTRGNNGGSRVVLFDPPAWRQTVGIPDRVSHEDALAPDGATWMAIQDGEVYGIGYAVNPHRLEAGTPVNLDDEGWRVELTSYGYYGRGWAAEAALEQLPTLADAGLSDELAAPVSDGAGLRALAGAVRVELEDGTGMDALLDAVWALVEAAELADPAPTAVEL